MSACPSVPTPNSVIEQEWVDAVESANVSALQTLLAVHPHLLNAQLHHQTFQLSTALHLAVWKGHRVAVEFLIEHGADIELQDQTGMTALQIDVMRICLQKMRSTMLLRSRCIDVDSPVAMAMSKRQQDRDRSNCRDIDTSVMDMLLDNNACVDQSNECGDTALLDATEYGLVKHVEKLLAHGADANIQDQNGRSPMNITGEHGFVDIVNVLAANCPSLVKSVGGGTAVSLTHVMSPIRAVQDKTLVMAVRHEYSGILETLYDRVHDKMSIADGQELGGRLLNIATEYNAPACALFLLKRDTPMGWTNTKGENAVQIACARGRPEILELLLEQSDADKTIAQTLVKPPGTLPHYAILLSRWTCFKSATTVLRSCVTTSLLMVAQHSFPVFFAVKIPANLEIMEVLIRHSAKFDFPTLQSRDTIAPLLVSWLMRVAPADVTKLLVDLASSEAILFTLRYVISSLTWQGHTHEALLFALTILFSPQAVDVEQALAVFKPWMLRCEVNLVTQRLVTDAFKL